MTKDLDLWVWPEATNAERLVEALEEFGFGSMGLGVDDFLDEDVVIQLGYPPNRVDILTSPSGVEFEACWVDRLDVQMDGRAVPFIGLDGLKANKRATGRPQDLVDLHTLEAGPQ